MTKLRDDGTTQTGTYKVDVDVVKKLDWLDYNWSYGSITFTDVAPLVPKHGDLGDAVVIYTYDILERPDLERDYINSGGTSTKFNRRLSLSMASEGTGSWGTAYYWVYEQVRDTVRVEPATLGLLYGERVVFDDEEDMAGYWLDYDCFIKSEESNTLIFVGGDGNYKISRDGNDYTVNNEKYKHIAVEAVDANGEPATTQADGSGAVWVIGNKIGKPSFESNDIAGDGSKALCMIPIGGNKYRITLVPGVHIDVEDVDFKFYYGKGTDGGSFTASNLTTESEYVTIASDGTVNKADDVVLRKFVAYEFILDLSAGRDAAVLTVNEIPPVF